MFQCKDRVLYGMHGVCEIVNIETKKISGKATEYYVLQPIDQSGSKYYVPTQNQNAVAKMQPILTQEELNDILHSADIHSEIWIDDETQRKQHYCHLISSGDRAALVRMVHAIHKYKEQLSAAGKRLHMCDDNFLRDAEKLLGAEFSLILNIGYNDVGNYVKSIIDGKDEKG